MDLQLTGKKALVTGSGKGIGRGIALALAKEGVHVAVNYQYSEDTAKETMAMLNQCGAKAVLLKGDVSSAEGCRQLVESAARQLGGLDILVNNAALQLNRRFEDCTEENYRLIIQTNLFGYWNCIKYAVPHLEKSAGGRIICISSVHAKRPTGVDPLYAMSKGAIKMLVREAAIRLASKGITCNEILPAVVDIEFKTQVKGSQEWNLKAIHRDREYRGYPVGRFGRPEDIANAVCYFAGVQAEHITGASLRIDGGAMLV